LFQVVGRILGIFISIQKLPAVVGDFVDIGALMVYE